MSHYRILEVNYETPPAEGDIAYFDGDKWLPQSLVGLINEILPPGVYIPYGGSVAPAGWLFCDGSAISRAGYATLFTAIQTNYGVGDGSTTFNLPNLASPALPYGNYIIWTGGLNAPAGGGGVLMGILGLTYP